MMLSKLEPDSSDGAGNSYNGQLLREIEAISKALYSKPFASPSGARSKSAEKVRASNPDVKFLYENVSDKDKTMSSIWNWKKSFKSLAQVGRRKFNICFFLHVHSIGGLPGSFNDFSLRVHWKRKDEVLSTSPSRVLEGIAEFEKTLMHKCCVYGSRSRPHHSAKYDAKLFLIYASIVGAPGIDLGKHWVDLTRILPLSLEELEGEKSSGKWTTSFRLAGKAKGASLNVSFGFSVIRDGFVGSRINMNVSELVNLTQDLGAGTCPRDGSGILKRVGSVPSNLDRRSDLNTQSLDLKVCREVLPNLGLELSKSINFLYQKLDEENLHSSAEFRKLSEYLQPLKPSPHVDLKSATDFVGNEFDDIDFDIIEQGIELSTKEQLKLEQISVQNSDSSAIKTVNVDEIIEYGDITLAEETDSNLKDDLHGNHIDEVVMDDCKHGDIGACVEGSNIEELESALQSSLISESTNLESLLASDEFLEQPNSKDVISNYKAGRMSKRSISLDDISESVASDFLNMLGIEQDPSGMSSNNDPESPRGRLLREFEEEALASGNFILDFDAGGEQEEPGSVSGCGDHLEDFDFSSIIQVAEVENKKSSQFLSDRRKAKRLEDLETEALMQEWGLNEKVFQISPCNHSDGFGSPIELPAEEPVELPPLGDGLGPCVQTKGAGYLRSMNPALFRNSKNVGSLFMQVSSPVVLPAELGSEILEILQHLASLGIEKLSAQANKLMPLEDITGKMLQEIAKEATAGMVAPERSASLQREPLSQQDSCRRKEGEDYQYDWSYNDLNLGIMYDEIGPGYVSLEDLVPLAMDKIETLLLEGLRIQSGMSDEEAPSSISPQSVGKMSVFEMKTADFNASLSSEGADGRQPLDISDCEDDAEGLVGLSLTMEEWLQLDAGIIRDEEQISEHTLKILAAHHAKCIDLLNRRFTKQIDCSSIAGGICGLLGKNLTLALTVLLRDPLRNYEAVGVPMLAVVQVERALVPQEPNLCTTMLEKWKNGAKDYEPITKEEISDKKTDQSVTSWFRTTEVHLAGLNTEPDKRELWGTKAQQQLGSRWLLASGMGKSSKLPFSKSTAIVLRSSYPRVTRKLQTQDVLWSITSSFDDTGTDYKKSAELFPHIRNPDIIFPNERTRSCTTFNFL